MWAFKRIPRVGKPTDAMDLGDVRSAVRRSARSDRPKAVISGTGHVVTSVLIKILFFFFRFAMGHKKFSE